MSYHQQQHYGYATNQGGQDPRYGSAASGSGSGQSAYTPPPVQPPAAQYPAYLQSHPQQAQGYYQQHQSGPSQTSQAHYNTSAYGQGLPYSPSSTHARSRPPVPPRPHPPPPPPGAAAPQYGRPQAEASRESPYGSQPPYHHQQQTGGHDGSVDIISMYGSPTNGGPPVERYPHASTSTQPSWQTPSLHRTQSAASPQPSPPLRPQYPQTPYTTSAVPTVAAVAPVRSIPGFPAGSSSVNGYHDSQRRPSEPAAARPNYSNYSYESIPRLGSSSGRPPIDSNVLSSTWATPVSSSTATPDHLSAGGHASPMSRQRSFDRMAVAKRAVAEAAGGDVNAAYHAERRDAFPDYPSPGSTNSPSNASTPPPAASASFPAWPQSQPSFRATTSSSGPPRSDSFSSQHSTMSRPSPASKQSTLSPNSSLTVGGSSWGVFRDDSVGSTGGASRQSSPGGAGHEYLNPSLLSNVAVYVKDRVPRGLNSKGALEFPDSFTGEQLVTTIQKALPPGNASDRRNALQIARSLQQALWFNEVDWSDAPVKDSSATVFTFENAFEELPTGIVTSQTSCYSPFCGKLNEEGEPTTCYSYTCPNTMRNRLHRAPSMVSTALTEASEEPGDNWLSSVSQSVRDSVDKRETKRQLVIFELVATEKAYNDDLDVVQEGFVEPLLAASPPIIPPERQASFLADVLLNVATIRKLNHAFLDRLLARQRENPVVRGVGDLMLEAAPEWRDAYIEYAHKFNLAETILKEEKADNPRFSGFLMDFHKFPKAARQNFESFHKRPTLRLLRYNLILKEILKNTPEDHPDREWISQAVQVLSETGKACDEPDPLIESKVACRQLHRSMRRRPGDSAKDTQDRVVQELELLSDSRRHFTSSRVFRRPDGATLSDWSENYLILFDHYLLFTKAKDRDGASEYRITRRPIPLELLQFRPTSFLDPPIARSSGFHLRTGTFRGGLERSPSEGTTSTGQDSSSSSSSSTLVYPISLYKIGRNEGLMTFYVESKPARDKWEQKLREALELRAKTQEANQVVQLDPLSDRTFTVHPDRQPTCSAPLTIADGQSLVIAGCESGLFIGFRGQTMKQVVALQGITQCAVLQEFGLVIVLAQGALIAYSLEALIPSGRASDPSLRTPQRLSGKHPALFFRVGKVTDAQGKPLTLVIYNKKGGVKESVFKALEPISIAERQRSGHKGFFGGSKSPEWFRTHKDFFLPSLVISLQFLRSKLAIVLARGVEIMDLTTLRTMSVPDFSKYRHDPGMVALQKRCDEAKTLGMFRLADNLFLLVFDEFAFHVDKHGEPIAGRAGSIDWESKPETVAFQLPYIYAFSSNMIEVRHAMTGQLVQVIPGQAIQLLYDGTGIDSSSANTVLEVRSPSGLGQSSASTLAVDPPERRIHFTMRAGEHYKVYEINPVR